MTNEERIEILEEVLAMIDEIAEKLRPLADQDPQITRRVLPQFEGREHGWLGEFARDVLQERLDAYQSDEDDGEDER